MSGHTPGPWEVVEYGDGDSLVIHEGSSENRICFMAMPGKLGDFEKIKANAHLIAAAPDLLEACRRALPANVDTNNKNIPDDLVIPLDVAMGELRMLKAAIAKATQEADHADA